MASGMPHDPARNKMIRNHLKRQEEDAGGKDRPPQQKLMVKGRAERAPVYRLNTADLAFNKSNGRIKAEVAEKEGELGRYLDIFNPDDQRVIASLLLSMRPDENEKIKQDLRKNGQLMPGIITCDGTVINGNRRKAILEELFRETKDTTYAYLDVQVLPSDITKAELWLIEAGIQLSAPQQLDYSPINHLLKLREGINAGLKIPEMVGRIYGVSEEQLNADLQRLQLIDEYLGDFQGKEGRYHLVRQRNEHFIDLQVILSWVRDPRGPVRRDWEWDESDINELKLTAFYYIRMGMAHLRIRELRDLFATQSSWLKVKEACNLNAGLSGEERSEVGLAVTPEPGEDEAEESQDFLGIASAVEDRDNREEELWKKKRSNKLKTFYEDAKEQVQIVRDSERPIVLARRALRNIQAIPEDPERLDEPDLDAVLSTIILETNARRKIARKNPVPRTRRPKKARKRQK